jgi:hypothetical protein
MEDGAKAVRSALELIKQRIATALGKEIPFNEVLSAAYMEKQKMAVSDMIFTVARLQCALWGGPCHTKTCLFSSTVIVSEVWAPL